MSSKAPKSDRQEKLPAESRADLKQALTRLDTYLIARAVTPQGDVDVDRAILEMKISEGVKTQFRSAANTVALAKATEKISKATERLRIAARQWKRFPVG